MKKGEKGIFADGDERSTQNPFPLMVHFVGGGRQTRVMVTYSFHE